jgi:PleD family two-component response regulator
LAGTSQTAADSIMERIRQEFKRSSAVAATVSIGVAELNPEDTSDQLIQRADGKLYAAKQARITVAAP